MSEKTYILIGLGNPGRQYGRNRHNVGFMLIDRLAVRLDAKGMRLQSKALISTATYLGSKVLLAKPQTYMNLSGDAVQSLAHFYRLPLENLLVAHDDLDLPFGTLRLRPGGGHGGQKGVASAIERLGSRDFARLRIGIGHPPGRTDPADYVLQDFAAADRDQLAAILDRSSEAVLTFITDGLDAAMNRFNGATQDG
jgi:PTH1 family peptidyl-tRNA hydrolase